MKIRFDAELLGSYSCMLYVRRGDRESQSLAYCIIPDSDIDKAMYRARFPPSECDRIGRSSEKRQAPAALGCMARN